MKKPTAKQLLPVGLAALSGVLYFLGFIGFNQFYLEWIAFAPLVVALDGMPTGRRAFFLSWWMGLCTHLGGYYWIVHLLQTFAYLPLAASVLGYLLLCLFQGSQLAVNGWLAWKLSKRTGIPIGFTLPVSLITVEFAYPLLFPSYTANSQAWVPLMIQVAELGGTLLLSGIIALVGGALGEIALARVKGKPFPKAIALAAAASFAFVIVWGLVRMPMIDARDAASPKLKTAIVQANVGAGDKHLRAEAGIRRFREMTDAVLQAEPNLGLVVWPESALNRTLALPANLTGSAATEVKVPMIVGALRKDNSSPRGSRYWNSLLDVAAGGQVIAAYDKVKLLVFGETLPLYDTIPGFYHWLLKQGILPYLSVYDRGTNFDPLPVGPYKLSADICYEDILPGHIGDLMRPDAQGKLPNAMVNGTNDSWYGPAEPPIHLALALFRSVEHRRWLVRSTATGISAFIDSNGRLVKKSGFETAETLVQDVPMVSDGRTVYGTIGDVLGWLALAFSVVAVLQKRWRPSPPAPLHS